MLYCDNQGTMALATNPSNHKRTKHIDVRYHYIRESIENGSIRVEYVKTADQAADGLTKALGAIKHAHSCSLLRIG